MWSWITKSSGTNLPPGPVPLPIIRNLFSLGKKHPESLARLTEVYGPLMSIKLSSSTTVVISSSTMAKEILQKRDHSFSSRTVSDAIAAYDDHKSSMICLSVCLQWRNLRKLTNSHIFNAQKLDASEDLRQQKLTDLVSHVHQNASIGCAVDIGQATFLTILNLISNIVFSIDLADFDSNFISTFKTVVKGVILEVVKSNLFDYFPILRFLDAQCIRRRMRDNVRILEDIFNKIIDQKLLLLQYRVGKSSNSGDLLDRILDLSSENDIEL
ncbi:geraniol 8-hydroxylase-like [Papaver somniferum]|uniref:geraniol 8-hydroxylase-like n=1 Tax=Papaver somniferum TaxID=3469 RepID=UPI000E701E70|nr:geraniol 8-hydroxylase-like [Papaver somniferum]